MENGMLALMNVLWGQEVNNGIGLCDCSTVLSYEQMIVDHDMVGRALTAAREVPVTKETLHLDMIKDVGILGLGAKKGSFLGERATMMEARQYFQSMIFNSEPFEQWEAKGAKDDMTVAKEKADWILKNHEPVALDRDILTRIDKIVKDAS
jgi:trimethylamine:corrinoid methyltransferase-like protein